MMGIVMLIIPMPIVYTLRSTLGGVPDLAVFTPSGEVGFSSTWPLLLVSNGLAIRIVILDGGLHS